MHVPVVSVLGKYCFKLGGLPVLGPVPGASPLVTVELPRSVDYQSVILHVTDICGSEKISEKVWSTSEKNAEISEGKYETKSERKI